MIDLLPYTRLEIERMRHGLSTEQMRTRPVTVQSREPDYRDSKKSKHMLKVYTASKLVLPRERQSNLGNDTNAQSIVIEAKR
ncbi:hypothetical protein MAR_002579 [Mya arenaria]|uniref:Uncharacterized protein n=1 Tax=Mya arenaria TaxID=6604 RepID=A0ABY7G7K2_MYAAR|nr:hypothetical protein MAR_002579 [Mya arenaria]